jgi:hypothetical protein
MAYNELDVQDEYEALEKQRQQQALANQLRQQQASQSQQSQQGGMGGMGGMNIASQFMGGGEAAGGATAGGGSAGGGSASLVNPWTALAAVIIGNEREGIRGGDRDESTGGYAKDLATGSVLQQDISKRWSPKIFGKKDKYGLGGDADMASEFMSGDISHGFKKMKDTSLGKALRKIF